jgi:hypothetical protein
LAQEFGRGAHPGVRLVEVSGVGATKLRQYGDAFLAVIREDVGAG